MGRWIALALGCSALLLYLYYLPQLVACSSWGGVMAAQAAVALFAGTAFSELAFGPRFTPLYWRALAGSAAILFIFSFSVALVWRGPGMVQCL